MKQAKLNFAPVARFPERRLDGAAIVVGPVEAPPPQAMERAIGPQPPPPAKKPRRDHCMQVKKEILSFSKNNSLSATRAHFPEASESTIKRLGPQEATIAKAIHALLAEFIASLPPRHSIGPHDPKGAPAR